MNNIRGNKNLRSFKTVRKFELKEWSFSCFTCILISIVIAYDGTGTLKKSFGSAKKGVFKFIFKILRQSNLKIWRKNNRYLIKSVGMQDLFSIITELLIIIIFTFLAPCRNLKKWNFSCTMFSGAHN